VSRPPNDIKFSGERKHPVIVRIPFHDRLDSTFGDDSSEICQSLDDLRRGALPGNAPGSFFGSILSLSSAPATRRKSSDGSAGRQEGWL
jgi:hypothetical protein